MTSLRVYAFSCILAALAVLHPVSVQGQLAAITEPLSEDLIQQTNGKADIKVSSNTAGIPAGGSVEFVLDMGLPAQSSHKVTASPYTTTFTAVPLGEHTVDAFILDSTGAHVGTPDHKDKVGVGDIVVAIGDSITAGEVDDITYDDYSADGRNGPIEGYGGYEPILNDVLTGISKSPHSVPNEGLPGENTIGAKSRISEMIADHPTAKVWLVAYGTNDANTPLSPSAYQANLQYVISQIQAAIPGAVVYLPRVFYHDETGSGNKYIPGYDAAVVDLTNSNTNVFRGADLETLFKANHKAFPDHEHGQPGTWLGTPRTHHPNGVGIQKMAMLWKMALTDRAFLVTDGYFNTLGSTDTDRLEVEAISEAGVNAANLLEVCDQSGRGSPPPGTTFVGDWRIKLLLTGVSTFASQGVYVTLRVDDTGLLPEGATWNQVYLSKDNTILETTRSSDATHPYIHYLTARVKDPGQVAPVLVTNMAAPTTVLSISPAVPNGGSGWYVTSPKISLTAKDAFGTAAKIYCAWDTQSVVRYYSAVSPPAGQHVLYYRAIDNSDNTEMMRNFIVKSDPTPPVTPSVTTNSQLVKLGQYISVSWSSKDPESGVDQYVYAIGTGPGRSNTRIWTPVYLQQTLQWKPTGPVGTKYYFSVKVRNRAGVYSAIGVSNQVTVTQ